MGIVKLQVETETKRVSE